MKKICFLLISIISISQSYAQYGYRYHDNFIEIKKTFSNDLFVQVSNKNGDVIKEKTISNNLFLSDNQIGVPDERITYFSHKYRINHSDVYVLPTIAFCLENDQMIDTINCLFKGDIQLSKEGSVYYLQYPFRTSDEVLDMVSKIDSINEVEWCEPDMQMNWDLCNPLYPEQFYLKNTGQRGSGIGIDINVEPAWMITNGSSDIVIAVLDDGVDKGHEDLLDRVLDGYTVDDASSKGAPKNSNSTDQKAHGIACAGIIAATDNNVGIKGIANNSKILPINIFPNPATESNKSGGTTNMKIASAIRWAYPKSDVLNNSWGSAINSSNIVESAFRDASKFGRNGKGCVIVAASGNGYNEIATNDVSFPAKLDNVIAVGAIAYNGDIFSYSERGNSLNLVAPSGDVNYGIVSLDRMGELGISKGNYSFRFCGTSASCPQVAGVAALMLSVNPDLTAQQVRNILQQTARDLGPTGFDTTYGYGLVNAGAAVIKAGFRITGPTTICNNGTYTINGLPSGFTVNWRFTNNALIIASGQGTTTLNVSKNSDAKITLYADIKHNGSIVTTLSKEVFVGTPMLGMMINPIGADGIEGRWCEGMAGNKFTIEGKSAVDAYDYLQVKIYKLANNGTKTLAYTNNNFLYGSSIPYTFSNGFYELQVRGVKDCGTSQWLIGQVSATSGSGGGMFPLDMQISYDPSAETLNVTIMEDEGGDELQGIQASINNNTKTVSDEVYDVQLWSETAMVRHFTTTDSCFTISMNGLKRGTYILRVSKNGKIVTKKVIK